MKTCPLFFINNYVPDQETIDNKYRCRRHDCAWFDQVTETCAVLGISQWLGVIGPGLKTAAEILTRPLSKAEDPYR